MIASTAIKEQARALGFDLCGVAPATDVPELAKLGEWLARGYAGDMLYLHKSADTRADIRRFLPGARSVIVTATNYFVGTSEVVPSARGEGVAPSGHGAHSERATSVAPAASPTTHHIARYAWGDDYHVVLADRLEQLVAWMREQIEEPFDARIFVDKHHVQERAYARHAGLGWIGKNTMLIHPDIGSYTFLAGVAVSLDLEPDQPVDDLCGSCTLCIDSCPTGALVDDRELDATRCISYLTIEHKSAIPETQRPAIGDHVYGCDVCQEVCPYNLAPLSTLDPAWQPKRGRDAASPAELWQKSDFDLHRTLEGSAMTRVTVSRLRRNLAVVLGNAGGPGAVDILERPGGGTRRAAQSAETELVREHVEWARESGRPGATGTAASEA